MAQNKNATKASKKKLGWDMYGPAYPKDFISETSIPNGWRESIQCASGSMLFIKDEDLVVCFSVTPPGYGPDGQGGVTIQTCGPVSEDDIETVRSLAVKPFLAWFEAEGYANV